MLIAHLSQHPHLLPEIARLHFAEWGHLRPGDTIAARQERLAEVVGSPGSIPSTVVALDGDVLCGSAMLLASDMGRSDISPWFAGLYVKPEYRGDGLASALLERVLLEASIAGATSIYLCAEPDKEAFYANRGWSLVEHCDWHNSTIIVMSRLVS